MTLIWILAALIALAWLFALFALSGPDLGRYDEPRRAPVGSRPEASPEHAAVAEMVRSLGGEEESRLPSKQRVARMREVLESALAGRPVDAEVRPVDAGGVAAEWVLAPGSDPSRRLLYLHGGAFMAGSPRSHRSLTAALSKTSGAAVLSVDYRLLPEHTRLDCVEDCCRAYEWILGHGPDGESEPRNLFVAGDSAGGNLTLVVLAWARDQALRAADGAIAFSPLTDGTFSGPSIRDNIATDPMLGPGMKQMARLPRPILLWGLWFMSRVRPTDLRMSPLFGDLSGLPPTLVQASEAEVLLDDGRRYVNKAVAQGSPAEFESWPGVVHVFQAFVPDLPEANEALERAGAFLERCAPRTQESVAS